ncbi:radical SAM/SPASM domain-containing protein [Sulfurospirillum sp. 1612]|uniref:radical SAM/SPASM domain-containing protein n=1 Tax=Sulfurospirillum sp. 1612 TaxID=3094835 RepID=UPI002F91DB57
MSFHRAYIEITNICGLQCTFCPTKTKPTCTMDLDFFTQVLREVRPYTKEVALHVFGDPLALSNLNDYLDIAQSLGIKVMITTSGLFLKNHKDLCHPSIRQINISLNSYNKNTMRCTFEEYMAEVLRVCQSRVDEEVFINLRLWNLDKLNSEDAYNKRVLSLLSEYFHVKIDDNIMQNPPKTLRLAKKILVHFDHYFEWPSLNNPHYGDGFCHGLSAQLAILADGTVVPCCLDGEGVIHLGNLHHDRLKTILNAPRAQAIIEGFANHKAVESLCQKCSFKARFNNP